MNEVKLRIKSPSASIPDLYLDVKVDKDVHHVKKLISEQFPEHPSPEDQKLVYSGRLLQDSSQLNKILRFEDECSHFTIHLVCRLKETPQVPIKSSPEASTTSSNSANGQDGLRHRRNVPGTAQTENDGLVPTQLQAENMANQIHTGQMTTQIQSEDARQLETIHTMLQDLMSTSSNSSPEQLAVYQQMYMQYISLSTQYLNSTAAVGGNNMTASVQAAPPAALADPQDPLAGADGQVGNDALANIDNNAAGAAVVGGEDGAGGGAVDPLEYAYSVLRIAILFCIMYTHSSFFRLLFVVLGLLAVYYLRNRNTDQDGAGGAVAAQQPEVGGGRRPDNQLETDPAATSANDSDDESTATQEAEEEPKPNIFTVAFTFVSTLVSSILPDNANLIQ